MVVAAVVVVVVGSSCNVGQPCCLSVADCLNSWAVKAWSVCSQSRCQWARPRKKRRAAFGGINARHS